MMADKRVRCRCGKSQLIAGTTGDNYLKKIGWEKVPGRGWRCRSCVKKRRALMERARNIKRKVD